VTDVLALAVGSSVRHDRSAGGLREHGQLTTIKLVYEIK
jgi:hypothetical protein